MAIHFIHALWNKTPKNAISFDFAEIKNILQKQQKLDYLRNYCCDEFIMCNKPDSDFNQTQIEPENRVGSRHTSQNLRCTKQSVGASVHLWWGEGSSSDMLPFHQYFILDKTVQPCK